MTNIKGAIFDLDGTLIDSMNVWKQIDVDFLGKRGIEVPEDYINAITPMGFDEAARYTIKRFGFSESPEAIIKEWYDMALDAYSNKISLKDGVMDYLKQLKKAGVHMAIATASDITLVNPVLNNNGIYSFFENITTIKEVKRGKGFPDVYIAAADKMGLRPEECVVFEDILQGVQGSKAGKFYTVGVYDFWSEKDRVAMEEIADKYIESFKQLLK